MSRSRRRHTRGRVLLWVAPLAAAAAVAAAAVVIALPSQAVVAVRTDADSASPLEASYQAVNSWGTGYTGQYTITNAGTAAVTGWTLTFQLPDGTSAHLALGRRLHRRRGPGHGDQRQLGRHDQAGRIGLGRLRHHVGRARPASRPAASSTARRARPAARPRRQGPPPRRRPPAGRRRPRLRRPLRRRRRPPRRLPRRPSRPRPRRRPVPRRARRRPARPDSPRTWTPACSRRSAWSPRPRQPA